MNGARIVRAVGCVASVVVALAACDGPAPARDAGYPVRDQIFRLAADKIEGGGALLGVRVVRPGDYVNGVFDQQAYLVGGFVGVDPAEIPASASVGRLMGYDGAGHFRTLCRADRVLYAVATYDGNVYAAGDGGRVLRYDPGTHACDVLSVPADDPAHPPDFRAIVSANDLSTPLFFVGSTMTADGPRAAIDFFDRFGFGQEYLPPEATSSQLLSATLQQNAGILVSGTGGVILHLGSSGWEFLPPHGLGADNDIISVSAERLVPPSRWSWALAVVGRSSTNLVARTVWPDGPWCPIVQNAQVGFKVSAALVHYECETFLVGPHGYNAVLDGLGGVHLPATRLTESDLLAVDGQGLVLAVGGDTSDHTRRQGAVILIRGDYNYVGDGGGGLRPSFDVDGVSYQARGLTISDFAGCSEEAYAFPCQPTRDL